MRLSTKAAHSAGSAYFFPRSPSQRRTAASTSSASVFPRQPVDSSAQRPSGAVTRHLYVLLPFFR
jgi:hypothetical protein